MKYTSDLSMVLKANRMIYATHTLVGLLQDLGLGSSMWIASGNIGDYADRIAEKMYEECRVDKR